MFEVVSALESRKGRKRLRFATFSVAVHGLVLGSLVAASLWQVGDITPPNSLIPAVILDSLPGPPPPKGDLTGGRRNQENRKDMRRQEEKFQPSPDLPDVPRDLLTTVDDGSSFATDDDSNITGAGMPPGVPWGTEGSTGPITGRGNDSTAIDVHSEGVLPPVPISQPKPAYPDGPRMLHQQGVVILQAIIGTDGSVENLNVLKGAFPLLDEAAVNAVSRWRYTPATLNGRAVRVYLTVTVNFTLR
jgi:protein TonB